MVANILLRLARMALTGVLSQVAKHVLTIQDRVKDPTNSIIQTVNGGVWVGRGADAFLSELSGECMPEINTTIDKINVFQNKVTSAKERIEQADEEAERLIRSRLTDAFNFY